MRSYEELANVVGGIAADLLDETLRNDIAVISDNEPDFALTMWLERLNEAGRPLPADMLDEAECWLPVEKYMGEFSRHREFLIAENRALPA